MWFLGFELRSSCLQSSTLPIKLFPSPLSLKKKKRSRPREFKGALLVDIAPKSNELQIGLLECKDWVAGLSSPQPVSQLLSTGRHTECTLVVDLD